MDIEKLIERMNNHLQSLAAYSDPGLAHTLEDAATALSTLQAENEKLRAELEQMAACVYYKAGGLCQCGGDDPANVCVMGPCPHEISVFDLTQLIHHVRLRLEDVKAERDAAKEAVKNMAEYIVCAGRVDYFLCDEISQEHHLKYQPKNDGNYDNEPCYKCVADWFLQGHKWQGSNW